MGYGYGIKGFRVPSKACACKKNGTMKMPLLAQVYACLLVTIYLTCALSCVILHRKFNDMIQWKRCTRSCTTGRREASGEE